MMKLSKYVLISAALLSGAACLTACSSDDTVSDVVNPNLSPDGKAVKTEFALNIPRAKSSRMSADKVQAEGQKFLGMQGIKLIPLTSAGYTGTGEAREIITLPVINGDNDLNARIKVYDNVLIPIGTQGFLFYGHAEEGNNPETKFQKGSLTTKNLEVNKAPSSYEFALTKVFDGNATGTTEANAILDALNAITAVEGWKDDAEVGNLYTVFTKLSAGSANSVLAAVQSLYDNVANYEVGKGKDIKDAIGQAFNVERGTVSWKEPNTFPTNLNLPEGCVALQCLNGTFSYANKISIGGTTTVNVANITYPSSLYYFANTSAKANSSPKASFPEVATSWDSDAWTGWDPSVSAQTRKIALAKSVNYAVAQLITKFKCDKDQLPAKKVNEIEQYVEVPTEGFTVTGLLIGGQPTKVNYDFQPVADEGFNQTVYDNEIAQGVVAKSAQNYEKATPNYTLLLSNWKGATEPQQNVVHFAVELVNNSKVAFQGADGVVPVGGTFYLIGKLDPANSNKPEMSGVTNPSVFMSDYFTTAKININTLATAYNTIPDLRSTNLQLGLSVDLTWKEGLSFDVNIGAE